MKLFPMLLPVRALLGVVCLCVSFLPLIGDTVSMVLCLVCVLLSLPTLLRRQGERGIPWSNIAMLGAVAAPLATQNWAIAASTALVFSLAHLTEILFSVIADNYGQEQFPPRPEQAIVLRDGWETPVPAEELVPGDLLMLRAGDTVPCDCLVQTGEGAADVSAFGSDRPLHSAVPGQRLLSGSVLKSGEVCAAVCAPTSDSAEARLRKLLSAEDGPSPLESQARQISAWYTPAALALAVLAAVLLPAFSELTFRESICRGGAVLATAVMGGFLRAVLTAYGQARYRGARMGILFTGNTALHRTAAPDAVLLEQTGALTRSGARIEAVSSDRLGPELLMKVAAHAVFGTEDPLLRVVTEGYAGAYLPELARERELTPGQGIRVLLGDVPVTVGTADWMSQNDVELPEAPPEATALYVALDGRYAGCIRLAEPLRDTAERAVSRLYEDISGEIMLLSREAEPLTAAVAEAVGIQSWEARADLPAAVAAAKAGNAVVALVGNGETAAEAMKSADVAVALGGLTQDGYAEAQVVTVEDDPLRVSDAIRLARRCRTVVTEILTVVPAVKLALAILALCGRAEVYMAAGLDALVCLLGMINGLRLEKCRITQRRGR